MSIYVQRAKIRRIFDIEFKKINKTLMALQGKDQFFLKFSPHIIDRVIQREINKDDVFRLLYKLENHITEVLNYCKLEPSPNPDMPIDPNVNYRPLRLEITDGSLWIGITADPVKTSPYGLLCRMAFFNPDRKPGKISTALIKV